MTEKHILDLDAGEAWEPVVIDLARPFKFNGVVYERCTLRVPTGADMELHIRGKDGVAEVLNLAVALSGWPHVVFQRMTAGDTSTILAAVGELLAGAR